MLDRLSERPYAHVSVFSRERGQRISEVLRAAQVSINLGAVTADAGLPRRAWGASGYGTSAGDAGLRGFTRAVTTTARRRRLPLPVAPATCCWPRPLVGSPLASPCTCATPSTDRLGVLADGEAERGGQAGRALGRRRLHSETGPSIP